MKKDRFTVNPSKSESVVWTVEDNESGVEIAFVEGILFDTCRHFVTNKAKCKNKNIDSIVADVTKWIGENYLDIVVCNESARCRAIWLLNDSRGLAIITKAIKGISPNDVDMTKASDILSDKVNEYVLLGNGTDELVFDQEIIRLLGVVSMLSDKEAMEVFRMASVFWNYKDKAGVDIDNFANNLLLWPVRLSREQQAWAMGNNSEIIEAEDFELEEEEEK